MTRNPKGKPVPPNKQQAVAPEAPNRAAAVVALTVALLTAGACVAMVWAEPRPIGDLFVAFASGRDTLAGKIATPDEWAFTTPGRVWFNQNYGTHLAHYLAYLWAGPWGVIGLKLLLVAAAAVFVALAGRQRGAGWAAALIAAGGVLAASRSYVDMRPNLTTLMLAPLMLWLFYVSRRRAYALVAAVAVVVLWANTHNGFIFGVGMVGLWAFCRLITLTLQVLRTRPAGEEGSAGTVAATVLRRGWPLLLAGAAAVLLANFLNPFTIAILRHPPPGGLSFAKVFEYLLFPFSIRDEAWRKLNEWQPMFPEHPTGFGTVWEFFVVTGILAGLTLLRVVHFLGTSDKWREKFTAEKIGMFLFDAVLATLLVYMSVTARRFIPLTVILLGPLVAVQLDWFARSPRWCRLVAWVPPAVGAALAWYSGEGHIAAVFALVLAPLAALAVVELVARQFSLPARSSGLMRWIALPLAALTLLAPVAHYGWRQYRFYQPYNPLVPRETLFQRMHGVLYMPVDAARFIRDNDITGRCLNDWRWEGYLRWMCPKVQVFLGGRAHQVYREETDTLVTMILEGTAGARLLADQDVHMIVVPPQEKYGKLLTSLLANNWGQVYYDEYNMVIVDANRAEGMDLLRRCAEGKLKFSNERTAALSRAVCMGNPVLKVPSAEILAAFLEANRLSPSPVSYKAVMQFRPEGLEGLRWLKSYLLQEDARLRAMNIQDANGLETLICRMSIAEGMARLAREEADYMGVKHWQGETQALSARIKALQDKWNIH